MSNNHVMMHGCFIPLELKAFYEKLQATKNPNFLHFRTNTISLGSVKSLKKVHKCFLYERFQIYSLLKFTTWIQDYFPNDFGVIVPRRFVYYYMFREKSSKTRRYLSISTTYDAWYYI